MTLIHHRCPNCDTEGVRGNYAEYEGYLEDEYRCDNDDCRVRKFKEYHG